MELRDRVEETGLAQGPDKQPGWQQKASCVENVIKEMTYSK